MASGGVVFTLIDVSQGYWQQELEENSRDYTAFSVPSRGHFRYTRSAQGLCNSAPCYQRLLDTVISGVPDAYVYIDDVIIASKSMADHAKSLELVLERFRQHNLKLRLSKAKIATDKVTFLGYEISAKEGVRAGAMKTQALLDCKEPHSITDLRAFIGLASFFRRTIPFFSHLVSPLTALLRKNSGWNGGPLPPAAKESFLELKRRLSERPTLKAIDFSKDFIVTVDSSSQGSAACLSQVFAGVEHPCIYLSRTNNETESKRAAFLLEANGIIWALRTLAPIIKGGVTKIRTDHRPLSTLDKSSTPILDKLHAELQDYSYSIEYLPGKIIPVDCLSRQAHANCLFCKGSVAEKLPSKAITSKHDFDQLLKKPVKSSLLEICDLSAAKSQSQAPKTLHGDVVSITNEQLRQMQKNDHWAKSLVCYLRYGLLPDTEPLRSWVLKYGQVTRYVDGIVGILEGGAFKALAPLNLRSTLLHLSHDHELAGHQNSKKSIKRLSNWFWPNMSADVEHYIKNCVTCQKVNPSSHNIRLPLQELPEVSRFNERIHLDILGSPYPASGPMGFKYCLVCCDAFSSFVHIIPLTSKATENVCEAFLKGYISHYGIPDFITIDSGSEFVSKLFRHLTSLLGCELRYATVGHSSANGLVENRNKGIVNYIRKYIENATDWSSYVPHVMYALNTACHTDKLLSPYEMVFKIKPVVPSNYVVPNVNYSESTSDQMIDNHFRIQQSVMEKKKESFLKHAKNYNARMHIKDFQANDIVFYVHNTTGDMFKKFQVKYDGPARILSKEPDGNYRIENLLSGRKFLIHANRLKPGSADDQLFRQPRSGTREELEATDPGVESDEPVDAASDHKNNECSPNTMPSRPFTRSMARSSSSRGLEKVMLLNQNHYWKRVQG